MSDQKEIKDKVDDTKIILDELEKFIIGRVNDLGITEAASMIGQSKQQLSNYIKGRNKISYKQVLDIAQKLS